MAIPGPAGAAATVGVIGLGQMGGSLARLLLRGGYDVVGHDLDPERGRRLAGDGGRTADTSAAVAAEATIVLTSLPSAAALAAVLTGDGGLLTGRAAGPLLLVETSTLDRASKERARAAVEQAGGRAVDCPISGTSHEAVDGDLAVYASGAPDDVARARPVLAAVAREVFDLGAYGNGSTAKYLANLLVAVHNAAAAEALVLATAAGLDPARALQVLTAGAGGSRMLEVRGPFMVEGDYRAGSGVGRIFAKDVAIITDVARELACPVPLFAVAAQLHDAAVAHGYADHDTAAVAAAYLALAGLPPGPLAGRGEVRSPPTAGR